MPHNHSEFTGSGFCLSQSKHPLSTYGIDKVKPVQTELQEAGTERILSFQEEDTCKAGQEKQERRGGSNNTGGENCSARNCAWLRYLHGPDRQRREREKAVRGRIILGKAARALFSAKVQAPRVPGGRVGLACRQGAPRTRQCRRPSRASRRYERGGLGR